MVLARICWRAVISDTLLIWEQNEEFQLLKDVLGSLYYG